MDAQLYGAMHGIFDNVTWVPAVAQQTQVYARAIDRQWDISGETVRTLTRAYVDMVQEGKIAPFSFRKDPAAQSGGLGIVSSDTAIAVGRISEATGIDRMITLLWANAFYLMYRKGRVPQKVYDPVTFKDTKESFDEATGSDAMKNVARGIDTILKVGIVVGIVYVIGTASKTVRVFKQ